MAHYKPFKLCLFFTLWQTKQGSRLILHMCS